MVLGTAALLVVATVDLVRDDEVAPVQTAQQVVATPQVVPTGPPAIGPVSGKAAKKRRKAQAAAPTYTPPPAPAPAEPDGPCTDEDITMTPVMAPAVAGRPVLVTLELRTLESPACTWTIDREHLAYKITAGDDDVWSSSHCPAQVPSDTIVVRRDESAVYRLAWSGRTSSRDCPGSMPDAEPGEYAVQAAAIGGEPSAVVPFTLTDPVDLEPVGPAGPPLPEGVDDEPERTGKKKNKNRDEPARN